MILSLSQTLSLYSDRAHFLLKSAENRSGVVKLEFSLYVVKADSDSKFVFLNIKKVERPYESLEYGGIYM